MQAMTQDMTQGDVCVDIINLSVFSSPTFGTKLETLRNQRFFILSVLSTVRSILCGYILFC